MSVIARLSERDFVIGGDAAYTLAQLEGERRWRRAPSTRHNYRRSLQELRLFRREFPRRDRHPRARPGASTRARARATRVVGSRARSGVGHPSRSERITLRRPCSLEPVYIVRTRSKISRRRPPAGARGSAESSTGKRERLAELDGDLRELEALPVAHARRAVDRDRHDRRAGLQREPADARLALAELAACASARPRRTSSTQPPRSRIASAVLKASSSWWPRRTGNTPPCV